MAKAQDGSLKAPDDAGAWTSPRGMRGWTLGLAAVCLMLPALGSAGVIVDGHLTPADNSYRLVATDSDLGRLYAAREGKILYLLMWVEPKVNDNVFGDQGVDDAALQAAGWTKHTFDDLIHSDHVELSLDCGSLSFDWKQDYAYDADGDEDPLEHDWLSDANGPDGKGPTPPIVASASSLQWNLQNSLWDPTLGGTRTKGDTLSSPPLDSYPIFDAPRQWEWVDQYETAIDVSMCGCDDITIKVPSMHNSPAKANNPNPSIAATLLPMTAKAGPDRSVCLNGPVALDASGSDDPGCTAGRLYEWRRGATVVQAASTNPVYNPPTSTPGFNTYTAVVTCVVPTCSKQDDVDVLVRDCSLAVKFGSFGAVRLDGQAGVEVRWDTVAEAGTVGFEVRRGPTAQGPWTKLGTVLAAGPGSSYKLVDPGVSATQQVWYVIQELVASGSGDATTPFAPATPDAAGSATRTRSRQLGSLHVAH